MDVALFPGWLFAAMGMSGLGVTAVETRSWWAVPAFVAAVGLLAVDARLVRSGDEEPFVTSIACALASAETARLRRLVTLRH